LMTNACHQFYSDILHCWNQHLARVRTDGSYRFPETISKYTSFLFLRPKRFPAFSCVSLDQQMAPSHRYKVYDVKVLDRYKEGTRMVYI
jgi:hypothetical protein